MITWSSEITMQINCIENVNKNTKKKDILCKLFIAAGTKHSPISNRDMCMTITFSETNETIFVDPVWLKAACEKAIKLKDL